MTSATTSAPPSHKTGCSVKGRNHVGGRGSSELHAPTGLDATLEENQPATGQYRLKFHQSGQQYRGQRQGLPHLADRLRGQVDLLHLHRPLAHAGHRHRREGHHLPVRRLRVEPAAAEQDRGPEVPRDRPRLRQQRPGDRHQPAQGADDDREHPRHLQRHGQPADHRGA